MAGFNFQPPAAPAAPGGPAGGSAMPFQLLSPQMLAQIAQASFRPPGGGGGMDMGGGGAAPPTPGMDWAALAPGLGKLAGALAYEKPPTVDELNEILTKGQKLAPSNASYGDLGGPGGTYKDSGFLGMKDFWSGKWLPTLGFSGGGAAAVSPTFTGGGSGGYGG